MDFHLSITDVKVYREFLTDFRDWGTTGGEGEKVGGWQRYDISTLMIRLMNI